MACKGCSGLGQILPSSIPATVGDVKAQPVRMADVFIFGPLMIYAGLGKATPQWLKTGMVIIGAGTIVYNLANYFAVEQRKVTSGVVPDPNVIEGELLPGLSGMAAGPMHKADPRFHRPITM